MAAAYLVLSGPSVLLIHSQYLPPQHEWKDYKTVHWFQKHPTSKQGREHHSDVTQAPNLVIHSADPSTATNQAEDTSYIISPFSPLLCFAVSFAVPPSGIAFDMPVVEVLSLALHLVPDDRNISITRSMTLPFFTFRVLRIFLVNQRFDYFYTANQQNRSFPAYPVPAVSQPEFQRIFNEITRKTPGLILI